MSLTRGWPPVPIDADESKRTLRGQRVYEARPVVGISLIIGVSRCTSGLLHARRIDFVLVASPIRRQGLVFAYISARLEPYYFNVDLNSFIPS